MSFCKSSFPITFPLELQRGMRRDESLFALGSLFAEVGGTATNLKGGTAIRHTAKESGPAQQVWKPSPLSQQGSILEKVL